MDDTTAGARLRVAEGALASAAFGDYEPGADTDLYDWHLVESPVYDEVRRVVPLRRVGLPTTARSTVRVTFVARFARGTATLVERGVARVLDHGVHYATGETFGSERVLRLHARPLVDADARAFALLGEAHGFLYARHRSTGDVYRRPLGAETGFQFYTTSAAWTLRGQQLVQLTEPTFPPTEAGRPRAGVDAAVAITARPDDGVQRDLDPPEPRAEPRPRLGP